MNRLPILRQSFVVSIAAFAAACGGADAPELPPEGGAAGATAAEIEYTGDFEGPLGLQLWSVREAAEEDLPGTLRRVREMGFQEVELAGTYGMAPERFRQELENAGLRATAMHTGYDRLRDSLEVVLDEAEALGVDYLGVAWIPHPEGQPFTLEMARQAAADFDRWGQAARERGIQFFYHNHGYEFRPGPDGTTPFEVLVRETDPQNVKFELDVFWAAHPGVDPAALLRQYPDRWELMHIKDMREGTPTGDFSGHAGPEANVPVGAGQIDYPAVLKAAEEIGVDRYYLEDESTTPLDNIPQSIEYLERVTF